MINILFAGDLVPTPSNYKLFIEQNIEDLLGEKLYNIWYKSDYRFFNLEAPIFDFLSPISKCGPNLSIPKDVGIGLYALSPTAVCLANNHILDHGAKGLRSTIKQLSAFNISTFGAGENILIAKNPYIIKNNIYGISMGIYACAEHEFSIAGVNKPGANPFDPLETFDHIHEMKKILDFIIVLYHGGHELFRYPSPNLQKICHKLIEKGADVVICQHSHCIGCRELYQDGEIIYGQGNFIFDWSNLEEWSTSLLINLSLAKDYSKISYIPIMKYNNKIRLAEDIVARKIIDDFNARSLEILNGDKLSHIYKNEVNRYLNIYVNAFKNNSMLQMINYLECESHREFFLDGLYNVIESFQNHNQ